jgi:hypothetical protein
MIDWDDVRYFLAVARGDSVRAAAEHLGVNHSTVLRRIAHVAIRVVYDRNALPLNLHGLKGPELFGGVYMSCDVLAAVARRST